MTYELTVVEVFEAIAKAVPDRAAIIDGGRMTSYRVLDERSMWLTAYLVGQGIGAYRERAALEPWESGQDHIGLYMLNCTEHLEAEFGLARARAIGINVNHRYVDSELLHLVRDAGLVGLIFHSTFAPQVERLRAEWPMAHLIQVRDDTDTPLLDGAIWYETALSKGEAGASFPVSSPDDLHILYTGGTTGYPKGVLWRQADLIMAGLGGRRADGGENGIPDFLQGAKRSASRTLPVGPFMHASGRWTALGQLLLGNTVVLPSNRRRFDPHDVLETLEKMKVNGLNIAGDAMAHPLITQLSRHAYDLSALRRITSGAAILSAANKAALMQHIPQVKIFDTVGSSETGPQGSALIEDSTPGARPAFAPSPGTTILAQDLSEPLPIDSTEIGWLVRAGRIPLGYLGDREKTSRTFRTIDGVRYAISGDRAQWTAGGRINLLGRDSATINTGGEKVFSEEVELALKRHDAVEDVIVCGRPSKQWGQEVVAIVALKPGHEPCDEALLTEAAKSLARYKLPKQIVYRERVSRSPSGKPDYAWALAQAISETSEGLHVAPGYI
jgi:acyl-CoA synthetase (AMP-forming)/AMP-acid ligase II